MDYNFFDHMATTRGLISFILFWMWYGNTTLILIAGMMGINPSLYEAAEIDGANGGQMILQNHPSVTETDSSVYLGNLSGWWYSDVRYSVSV